MCSVSLAINLPLALPDPTESYVSAVADIVTSGAEIERIKLGRSASHSVGRVLSAATRLNEAICSCRGSTKLQLCLGLQISCYISW